MAQWNMPASAVLAATESKLILVQGSSFCISGQSGDIVAATHGVFFRDTRFLSRLELRVNHQRLEPLVATATEPFSALFVSHVGPWLTGGNLVVIRRRYIGRGMREDVTIHNFGEAPASCSIELLVDADFAHLFEVKGGTPSTAGRRRVIQEDGSLLFDVTTAGHRKGVRLELNQAAELSDRGVRLGIVVAPRGRWEACMQLSPIIGEEAVAPRYRCGQPVRYAEPRRRLAAWRLKVPVVNTDHAGLQAVIERSGEDLGALRIFDPDFPERAVVAAGAPWFMTLYGRDSILTAWMALIVDPGLSLGVLQTLARFQGQREDPRYEEEPGRILHEMRFGGAGTLSLGSGEIYYGSIDATPLFVMLLGELWRWGLPGERVAELLSHADRALQWMDIYGDRDDDGYVEYQRSSEDGLPNQGWKDSVDSIRFKDGRLAQTPIALCEVQAYAYGAYLARAQLADEAGDVPTSKRFNAKAAQLKEAFNRDFWLEDEGWFAVGLDRDKRPIDSLASNMGHCLWTGIVDEDKAARLAERLLSADMFSGWGVRTLAQSMGGYNPISYHCGSVWPHDNAIIAAGLMRYGFVEEAHRVILAMIDAASVQGYRLPELFSGLDRSEVSTVVSYPTSCSPQAWASASPLLFLRTLLRLDPWVPQGKVWVAPVLPDRISRLRIERIPIGGERVSIEAEGESVKVEGLPGHIELLRQSRPISVI